MDEVGKDDLMRIEAEDILQSRVFSDQDEGMYGQSASGGGSKGQQSKDGAGDSSGGGAGSDGGEGDAADDSEKRESAKAGS